jgi:hypothetical protein
MRMFRYLAAATAAAGAGALAVPALAQTPYPYPYAQQQYPQAYPQSQYPQQYPQTGYAYPQTGYAYPQTGYAYPQTGYAYPGQQGYGQQNVVGAIIGQLLGNRYNVTDRTAVTQCATAAQAQAAQQYRPRSYGQAYGYQGYNGTYNLASMRVTSITDVERRNNGLRVSGLMSSGSGRYGAYAHNPAYANAASDFTFRCNVAYTGQVTDVRVRRNSAWRG